MMERMPLWPPSLPTGPQPQPTDGQVNIVVNDYQLGGAGPETGQEVLDSLAAVVHKGAGLGQHDVLLQVTPPAQDGLGPALGQADTPLAGQQIDTTKAHIVPGATVARAWIAQPDDYAHCDTNIGPRNFSPYKSLSIISLQV